MLIDHRETKLKTYFPDAEYELLEHGDIQIKDYVIERKTIADLIASIKDTRYRNQKQCLLSKFSSTKIIYIIEDFTEFKDLDPMVKGAIINTQLRDKIAMFFTHDIQDTANLLKEIETRINKYETTEVQEGPAHIRKTSSTYQNILCQIPGISNKTALAIIDKYQSIPILIENLKKDKLKLVKLNKTVLANLQNTFLNLDVES